MSTTVIPTAEERESPPNSAIKPDMLSKVRFAATSRSGCAEARASLGIERQVRAITATYQEALA